MAGSIVKLASFRGGKVELQDLHLHLASETITLLVETTSLADWRVCERHNFIFEGVRSFGSSPRDLESDPFPPIEANGIYEIATHDDGSKTYAFLFDIDSWFKIDARAMQVLPI